MLRNYCFIAISLGFDIYINVDYIHFTLYQDVLNGRRIIYLCPFSELWVWKTEYNM